MKKKTTLKTVYDELLALRKLLTKGWTKGALARNKYGNQVKPSGARALRFCLRGGMMKLGTSWRTEMILSQATDPCCSVAAFNDGHTKSEVLKLIDACVSNVKKKIR